MEVKTSSLHPRTSEKVLKSVVKLFVQLSTPNYSMPWQMKRQQQVFGSGFIISNRRILTNGHVVAYQKSVRVRKHGDAKKYNAHVIHVGHECDIAMLGVEDDKFWEDLYPLPFGNIPNLEEDVVCVGFPTGGDNISVTRGVVSRVEIQRYAHSAVELLAIQIDAAINSGNSGGPALQGDRLIGIAFETLNNAENIGYIIPVTVIEHFLEDIEKNNTYYGFCRLGIKWQHIDSEHLRSYFKMTSKQTGILVSKVYNLFSSSGKLIRGDVLMAIDNESIADNGTVHFRGNERILFDYILCNKFVNDNCKLAILRQGKVMDVDVRLDKVTSLVPAQLYDKRPSYLVYAGMVFAALSQPYMQHQYGKDWARKSPIRLCDRVLYGVLEQPDQEVIILSQVLASELTTGYENLSNHQLYKVNGVPLLNLKHLASVLDQITKPFINNTEASEGQLETIDNSASTVMDLGSPVSDEECHTLHEREKEPYAEDDCTPVVEMREVDNVCSTCESRSSTKERPCSPNVVPASKMTLYGPEKVASMAGVTSCASLVSSRREATTGLEEDPTLLSQNDYLHFELDKDKIIVLHIITANKHSPEILKQYAIGQPRSDDLI